jgi:hypothetical protein
MTKTQLNRLATKIHSLAVKSASGKKSTQNKAMGQIAALLNQAIEAEVEQAYAGIASHVRRLAEKLKPSLRRKAAGKKQATRKKSVAAKTRRKPPVRRSEANPPEEHTEQAEQTNTTTH